MNAASALPAVAASPPPDRAAANDPAEATTERAWFGDDGPTFDDLLDVVNPLHHLPIIGTVYRNLTDDRIDPAPRVAGGTLYGGPIGLIASLINTVVEGETGRDVTEHAYAFLTGDDETVPTPPEPEPQTDPGHPPADDFALVSEWARRELAFRQQVAAERGPDRDRDADVARLPDSNRPRNEAGLGTALFAQALRAGSAPALENDPAALTGPAARTTTPAPVRRPPTDSTADALDARLRALAASNPWAPGNDTRAEADGWFARSLIDGLDRYRATAPDR